MTGLFINGAWTPGSGPRLTSADPATGLVVWEGAAASAGDCTAAVAAARGAFPAWSATPLDARVAAARRFKTVLETRATRIARDLSRETGKALWETRAEVGSMAAKIEASIAAQAERAATRESAAGFGRAVLRHRPHGVMAVLGPYNFPGHIPNGHIVPALLAGDTVVFKPSEETPLAGAHLTAAWEEAGLPPGVLNLVQGGRRPARRCLPRRSTGCCSPARRAPALISAAPSSIGPR